MATLAIACDTVDKSTRPEGHGIPAEIANMGLAVVFGRGLDTTARIDMSKLDSQSREIMFPDGRML
jgi:hypothetical protein